MNFFSLSYSGINPRRRHDHEAQPEICDFDRTDHFQLYHSYSRVDEPDPASYNSPHTFPVTVDIFLFHWEQEAIQGIQVIKRGGAQTGILPILIY
jgi:hypothetical protein